MPAQTGSAAPRTRRPGRVHDGAPERGQGEHLARRTARRLVLRSTSCPPGLARAGARSRRAPRPPRRWRRRGRALSGVAARGIRRRGPGTPAATRADLGLSWTDRAGQGVDRGGRAELAQGVDAGDLHVVGGPGEGRPRAAARPRSTSPTRPSASAGRARPRRLAALRVGPGLVTGARSCAHRAPGRRRRRSGRGTARKSRAQPRRRSTACARACGSTTAGVPERAERAACAVRRAMKSRSPRAWHQPASTASGLGAARRAGR